MADRVFVIGRRTDLENMNILVSGLSPNKTIYEGDKQPFYLQPPLDVPGTTEAQDDAYVSGSRNTTLAAADEPAADDTTGGGNDVLATQTCTFGLAAYLQERVHAGGIADINGTDLTAAQANATALALMARVEAGQALKLSDINAVLAAQVAQTDLDGAGGDSKSYGTVLDVFRILSGEVYRRPRFVITCNAAGQFRSLAERAVLVAAQDVSANGGSTFSADGAFLTSTQAGYEMRPTLARNGDFNISLGAGRLAHLKAAVSAASPFNVLVTFTNPNNAYRAADVTVERPRAFAVDGVTHIPSRGVYGAVRVYNSDGLLL